MSAGGEALLLRQRTHGLGQIMDTAPNIPSRSMAIESKYGVKFLKYGDSRKAADKIIGYSNYKAVADSPLAILSDSTPGGTGQASVFAFATVIASMKQCTVVSAVFIALSLLLEDTALTTLSSVNVAVSAGLFFLLGPYVAVSLARWWQMRMEFLGAVLGAAADLNMYAAMWFQSGSEADTQARALILRYGLAAHTLLYNGARSDNNLEPLVAKGMLMPHEAAILAPLPSKSQMVFTWLAEFWNRALSPDQGGFGTSPVPNAQQQAPIVLKRCLDGRGAAGGALALVYTQLPFPYVHLLSFLVKAACLVNAVCQGAQTGYILSDALCDEGVVPVTHHTFRYEYQEGCHPAVLKFSYFATLVILLGWATSVLIYPLIYYGLLSIGIMVANPLGTDFIDFPGSYYQHVMKSEIVGYCKSVDGIVDHKRRKGNSGGRACGPSACSRAARGRRRMGFRAQSCECGVTVVRNVKRDDPAPAAARVSVSPVSV